jgi:hypothetical protein
MQHTNFADGYLFPNEVDVQFDVFGALVMHRIAAHVHGGDIVAEDNRRGRKQAPKFAEERA